MKSKMMIRILIALAVLTGASTFFASQEESYTPEKEQVILESVLLALTQAHLQPVDINDAFSQRVFDEFLVALDSRKRFFIQEDIDALSVYKSDLDDMLQQSDLTFFDMVVELTDTKIKESQAYYQEFLAQPFDFSQEESVDMDYEDMPYASSTDQLKERWRQRLKYYTLQELESRINAPETDNEEAPQSREEMEEESRNEVKEAYDRWYENYEKTRRSDRFEQFLNVITRQYDPHTAYFSPKGKQDFNMRMGGKLEGIGAQLSTVGELTQVVTIVPGGPVWKDDRIEVNDYFLKVAQEGEQAVDITGMRIDDVVSLIRGPKGTKVTLTVQKKDESQVDIVIERDVINLEIARARGAMLQNEDSSDKFGYIDLPMFYNSFDGPEGNSSAKDVAAFIDTLKGEGMDGLILDLRDNLGGALIDAIEISGLFIEDGPIVQVKSKNRRPYIHKDTDSGVHYDGPLIVLINSFSASASEIVAGALQDYDRAIIVGSQSFGKGSVQNFIDLDRAIRGNDEVKPLGELKLTIQKYYRVNGESTQLRGVMPDIGLPDTYENLPTGERENDRALPWSKIADIPFGQEVLTYEGVEQISASSKKRVGESEEFSLIKEYASWLEENKNNTQVPLHLDHYIEYKDAMDARADKYDGLFDNEMEGLTIDAVRMDFESEISQEEKDARAEVWEEVVTKDFYITEAMKIVGDIVHQEGYVTAQKKDKN